MCWEDYGVPTANQVLVFITGATAERGSHQMASQNSDLFSIGNTTHKNPSHICTHTLYGQDSFIKRKFPLKELPIIKKILAAQLTTTKTTKNPGSQDFAQQHNFSVYRCGQFDGGKLTFL